jgi:hypothetical protein
MTSSRTIARSSTRPASTRPRRKTSYEPRHDGHRDPIVPEPFVAKRKLLTRMGAAEHRSLNNHAAR